VALLIINYMYFMRAKTEERHLSRDPTYVAYALWMNEHGWLRFLNRIPLAKHIFIYKPPANAPSIVDLPDPTALLEPRPWRRPADYWDAPWLLLRRHVGRPVACSRLGKTLPGREDAREQIASLLDAQGTVRIVNRVGSRSSVTSSQVTGVDTTAPSRARIVYGATTVRPSPFWP